MKLLPRTLEEGIADYNWTWDFSFADIPAGIANNTALVVPLSGIVAAGVLQNPQMRDGDVFIQALLSLITPFANTNDAAFNSNTASFGDQGSATRYFNAVQLNLNGTFVEESAYGPTPFVYVTANLPQFLQFTLNSMAAKSLSNLNQGKLQIVFQLYRARAKEKLLDLHQPPYV